MHLSDQDLAQLEAYYMATLPPEERLSIEKRIRDDPDYGEAAESFFYGLQSLEMAKIHARRRYLEYNAPSDNSSKATWPKTILYLVVGIMFIAVILMFFRNKNNKNKPTPTDPNEECVIAFSEHYPRFGNKLSSGLPNSNKKILENNKPNILSLRDSALNWYESKCYDRAIPLLERALKQEENDSIRFYLGVAQLGVKQYKNAKLNFDTLRAKEVEPRNAILWYTAYAANGTGNYTEALNLLSLLQVTHDSVWLTKADSLSNSIRKR